MSKPYPSRWTELFDMAMSIIDQVNARGLGLQGWSFGGGTALMLHIEHRDSHDVDIFIHDPQYLPYLNPTTQEYDLKIIPSDYRTDGSRFLKIAFRDIGEIDFIFCSPITQSPCTNRVIQGHDACLETPAEILSKKLVFRGTHLRPRDMFDIACAARVLGDAAIIEPLSAFPAECQAALDVVRKMDPDLVISTNQRLMVRSDFLVFQKTAQSAARAILEAAISNRA